MKVPFLDLTAQYNRVGEEIEKEVLEVLRSGQYVLGARVKKLEEDIANYCETKHAIACASGTDALLLSLMAYDIGPGDEVITTPFTFFATAGVIARLGATIVYADVEEKTFNLDPEKVAEQITPRTKAIIPVHLFGHSVDMDAYMDLAKKHDLAVIEDACQAIGTTYNGRKIGSIGHTGCFSFFPTKNLGGAGDGGIVTTNDDALEEKIRRLRVHGAKVKYYHDMVGLNSRLDALQAAILLVKLPYIDQWNKERRQNAARYTELLQGLPLTFPHEEPYAYHIYHQYALRVDKRDEINKRLNEKGIGSGVYYPKSLHVQECFAALGYKEGDLPVTDMLCKDIFSLPIFPEMTEEQIACAANALRESIGEILGSEAAAGA